MKWSQGLATVLLVAATVYLGFVPQQFDFSQILAGGSLAFLAYEFLSFYRQPTITSILIVGILVRVLLVFAFPNLSDDIYRFLWDGQLIGLGMNPFGYLPSDLIMHGAEGVSSELFEQMNSPEYYTIYPPVAQLIFYASTIFSTDFYTMSLVIKIIFLVAEIFTFLGIVKILEALGKDKSLSILYFLNPLILVEGMVNLHFEIIMIVFFIWALYFIFVKKYLAWGALLFTLSIASKLLPLLFLPYFFFRLKGKQRIQFFLLGTLFVLLAFSPIIFGLDFQNFGSSIDLYFQKFEFNGGIYYVLRYFGKLYSGYNLIHYIGPTLGLMACFLIAIKAYLQKEYSLQSFLEFAFFSFLVYLFSTTTVHPWYLSIPILLSVFVKWRFAILWSFLVLLTYINYSYDPYWENLWIVALEYLFVFGFLVFEIFRNNNFWRLNVTQKKS
ncbi:MAG: hypothetical protein AAGA77_08080 [Bacteroidota bacterium]